MSLVFKKPRCLGMTYLSTEVLAQCTEVMDTLARHPAQSTPSKRKYIFHCTLCLPPPLLRLSLFHANNFIFE